MTWAASCTPRNLLFEMSDTDNGPAFGAPGIEPRWTSSAKEGFGTAYHTSCRLWFTLSHGIVNEIYYPSVDQPNTRDFQYLISDGETFCHEEKSDLEHEMHYPEKGCLFYRLTNSERNGRYRIIKHILADPHRSVLLIRTKLEILDASLKDKLRLYALMAPHLDRCGAGNSGRFTEISGSKLLHARRNNFHLVMGCTTHFSRMSVGYAGASDGWQDLRNFKMDWEFSSAENGNIALTGEIDPRRGDEFTVAIALGQSYPSTAAKLLQSLAGSFDKHRETYLRQWKRAMPDAAHEYNDDTGDGGSACRLSRCILLSHEDKVFEGAMVASMSIPWGETKGDNDLGGYHLVWTRDLVQSATALLATGQTGTPLRAMIWLAVIQRPDGRFPQNCWINGRVYWTGLQLDEIAAPILLAWRLRREGVLLGQCNPRPMIRQAAAFLLLEGPVTEQDRWEENAGYSPSTLAAIIAGLVCASEFLEEQTDKSFILDYADWLQAHVEDWTVTTRGELVKNQPRHYIRINPTSPITPDPDADPNTTMIQVANGGGLREARNVVGGDFLSLVRYGIRAADDPTIRSSIEVIDQVLKRELPQGPCWRRYNHDGYGQKADGGAFDGTGEGRSWPILTGERGHYELAAGRDPMPFIKAMEAFGNQGGMISEQLWDAEDLPSGRMKRGFPTGAAMPLCWSHAEYISLVRSRHDGVCFDRVEPAYQRYVMKPVKHTHEMWTMRHQIRRVPARKKLRVILAEMAAITWSADHWATTNNMDTARNESLNLCYADFATDTFPKGAVLEFTFFWKNSHRWEGKNFLVAIE
jgi:glucoamylase